MCQYSSEDGFATAAIGIQLAHAGRKASMAVPWEPERLISPEEGGWTNVVAASALAFASKYPQPHSLDRQGIRQVKQAFVEAAKHALSAGDDAVE